MNNEQIVRNAYHVAEIKDIAAWVYCFTCRLNRSSGAVAQDESPVWCQLEINRR
jgi:hypothetical protein